ncbi:MAG: hypothetical protein M3N98_01510, partial [Actinomycetota bacterium]|nr:hypothetical protein [Actinomycetota bacterium]
LLSGNNMVDAFHADPTTDLGAWGILINGDNNDIGFNRFQDNIAVCSNQGYKLASNSIELYTARNNNIHHNIALRDRVFSELGSSSTVRSSGNTYAYNVFVTAGSDSRFVTTRGALDTRYGPVDNTYLVHNSTYQTGANSSAIACVLGCGSAVLATDSNIFWADGKVFVADATFPNQNDLIWSSSGTPTYSRPVRSSAVVANPHYVGPATGNLRLRSASPAIGAGNIVGDWGTDVYGKTLPSGPGTDDVGAAQFQ